MIHDLRHAVRALRAAPVVSAVAILSLALGIGANTALFSIVNGLLLRTLPVAEPQELAVLGVPERAAPAWSYPVWEQVRARGGTFGGLIAWSNARFNTARAGETQFVDGLYVNGRYFQALGVEPLLGRLFTDRDDERRGGAEGPVAVLGYGFWQSRFRGSPDAVGATLVLERTAFTVVGVTPPGFFGTEVGRTFDVAVPFGTEPLLRERSGLDLPNMIWIQIMLRRQPGQTLEAATAILRGVQPQIREATMPADWPRADAERYFTEPLTLTPAAAGTSTARTRFERPIVALMVVVGLVLLIACANIANLMLARSAARRREMSVRRALGATRARLARQLLVESLLLAAAGASAGLLFARWAGPLVVNLLSTAANPLWLDLGLDGRVLAFTVGATVATAVVFGIAPAFAAAGVAPHEALKEGGRGAVGDSRPGVGNLLVVAQIALSLVLVVASGLFVGTFARLAAVNLGFEDEGVLVASVDASRTAVPPAERLALYERLRQAAAAAPGVERAAVSVITPVSGLAIQNRIEIPGGPPLADEQRTVHVNMVGPGFFATLRTPLLMGRDFGGGDAAGSAPVAIVNEALARKYYGDASPIGRPITLPGTPRTPAVTREIVGVASNAIYRNLRQEPPPTLYIPLAQVDDPFIPVFPHSISVRAAAGAPALLTRGVAAALSGVDPAVAITFRLVEEQVRSSLVQERVVAILSAFFGGVALLLAGLGLYGVTAYSVGRRRAEIGIRLALGAEPAAVVRMVLRRVAWLVLAGVSLGGVLSAWGARFVGTLLFGLEPGDPAVLAGAALVLGVVGAAAGWIPARRAARIDPAQVLREV